MNPIDNPIFISTIYLLNSRPVIPSLIYTAQLQSIEFPWSRATRVCTKISESPKFPETFRSVLFKRFTKFCIILEVSEADEFAKFPSYSAISVDEFIKTPQQILVREVYNEHKRLKMVIPYHFGSGYGFRATWSIYVCFIYDSQRWCSQAGRIFSRGLSLDINYQKKKFFPIPFYYLKKIKRIITWCAIVPAIALAIQNPILLDYLPYNLSLMPKHLEQNRIEQNRCNIWLKKFH